MSEPSDSLEILMPSQDLSADMTFFESLGFRLDQIFPSDDPSVARLSGLGLKIRLDRNAEIAPPQLNLLTDKVEAKESIAPNGVLIKIQPATYELTMPQTVHQFEVRKLKDSAPWVIGRAGMQYRDLIPDRLGGSIIASHIRIPDAGPVPDVVHYHTIGFQLIYCHKGWVRLVYEDQGPPFVLKAGDCVTQPPQIRHRVLEASENLEVVEIGVPAEHMTTIDHHMELPTGSYRPDREFGGQTFCRHQAAQAEWEEGQGFDYRDTGIYDATKGVADVKVLRLDNPHNTPPLSHTADIHFTFVLSGTIHLKMTDETHQLQEGDAFVIPPGMNYEIEHTSERAELLQIQVT